MKPITVGVLAFHGDVIEHIQATNSAAENLHLPISVIPVRTKRELLACRALIIPGGESTTLSMLCDRDDMLETIKTLPFLFGTCAGAILLAKHVLHKTMGQQTLELMDITIDRNAYGRQTESFQKPVNTALGEINAVFIRAPKIQKIGSAVRILAKDGNSILACEEETQTSYLMAACFHPELTTSVFHEYFLKRVAGIH